MALPLETEHEAYQPKPTGVLSFEPPRVVDTRVYPIDLAHNGWKARMEALTNGHTGNVIYSLSRKITPDLDLNKLGEKIGVKDKKGNMTNGYSLSETRTEEGIRELHFAFTGIPTAQTTEVLTGLVKEFLSIYLQTKPLLLIASVNSNSAGFKKPVFDRLVKTTIV